MKTLFYLDMVNFERFFFFSQYLFGYLRKTFYLCSIAQLVQQWAVGGLIYEKGQRDVYVERFYIPINI